MELLNENDIRWSELFYFLKKKLWIMIIVLVVCTIGGFLVGTFLLVPEYTAPTRMYVLTHKAGDEVAYEDLQIGIHLTRDYAILITGENVTRTVIDQLGLDLTPEALAGKIEVTVTENTRVLEIAVTDPDPELAAQIANAVREVASEQIVEIMEVDAVNLVHVATVPTEPSTPGVMFYLIWGGTLGLIACIGILILLYFLTGTIRNEDDVEFYLGLSTLGIIPISAELSPGTVKQRKA